MTTCRGECFVQSDTDFFLYLKTKNCNCELQECPSCFNKHPQIYLDCHGGHCYKCKIKGTNFKPGKMCIKCGSPLEINYPKVSTNNPHNWYSWVVNYHFNCWIIELQEQELNTG